VTRLACFAFRSVDSVGIRNNFTFAAQWLAYAHPYRRFGPALAGKPTRLGADAVRYSFIVVDFHHLLPAGPPALPTPRNKKVDLGNANTTIDRHCEEPL
jgi:hypothetical protein